MALVEVKVPDIGDFKEVEVIELMVKPGDTIAADQSLLTVESDKASMEIPSSHAGVVKELKVKVGDKVSEGTLVLLIEAAGAAAAPAAAAPAPAAAPVAAPAAVAVAAPAPAAAAAGPVQVVVPDIGDFDEVAVIEVFVKAGDSVKVEQRLITVESDKASMEIPSSHAGVVQGLAENRHVDGTRFDRRVFQISQPILEIFEPAPLGQITPHLHHPGRVIHRDHLFGPGRQKLGNQSLPRPQIGERLPGSQSQQ